MWYFPPSKSHRLWPALSPRTCSWSALWKPSSCRHWIRSQKSVSYCHPPFPAVDPHRSTIAANAFVTRFMQLFTRYRQDTVIEKQLASLANGAGTVRSTPAVLTITRRPICSNDYDTINHRKMPEFFVGFFKTGDTNASTGWRIAIETSEPALNLRRKTPTAGR